MMMMPKLMEMLPLRRSSLMRMINCGTSDQCRRRDAALSTREGCMAQTAFDVLDNLPVLHVQFEKQTWTHCISRCDSVFDGFRSHLETHHLLALS